jgi:mono/diheme cytochrome c family protein
LALVLTLLVWTSTTASPQITPLRQLSASLPPGEGKILVLKHCVTCHGPAQVQKRLEVGRGWPTKFWEDLVLQMIHAWGATIEPQEIPILVRYLTDTFAGVPSNAQELADSGAVKTFASSLPDGDGKDVVLGVCLSCHGSDELGRRIQTAPRDDFYWQRVVTRMQSRWEAPLDSGDVVRAVTYLDTIASKVAAGAR